MKTSSIAPASDGVSSGSVTRRSVSARDAPSPAAASSSVVSYRSSPALTNRKTYTYIVYACTKITAVIPVSPHGASLQAEHVLHERA